MIPESFSVDPFHSLVYHKRKFNCYHFTCVVWKALTGRDLTPLLQGEALLRKHVRLFKQLDAPAEPCIVVMQRAKAVPHVGVYLRGRVLHIREQGVEFQPVHIASIGFTSVRYATLAHP